MKYFNGFCLKGEEKLFKKYILETDFSVIGFSYGTQKAVEYALKTTHRIDRLILLSPAFFQNQKKSFVKRELRYFKNHQEYYKRKFLDNVAYPSNINLTEYLTNGTYQELESLLSYTWKEEKIKSLIEKNITIEVFIGGRDKIVDSQESYKFFSNITTTYFFKNFGHLLV